MIIKKFEVEIANKKVNVKFNQEEASKDTVKGCFVDDVVFSIDNLGPKEKKKILKFMNVLERHFEIGNVLEMDNKFHFMCKVKNSLRLPSIGEAVSHLEREVKPIVPKLNKVKYSYQLFAILGFTH
ncbi:hypothetical protein ACFSCX_00340 [Bacillus salitolerans]|uniref:Uncharacterized protein n=1 Tax=Bacillus salitolerans TaxID=1437434 RepID=A0ABW4LII5_9BACI